MHVQFFDPRKFRFEMPSQLRVQLYCMQLIGQRQQVPGQRSFTRTYLHDALRMSSAGGHCQLIQDRVTNKKVLPELTRQL